MPDTAVLMSANSEVAIHAYLPGEERTLCGLVLVSPEDYEDEAPPPRSADITGRRYYIGVCRLMCQRCTRDAAVIRTDRSNYRAVPLVEII